MKTSLRLSAAALIVALAFGGWTAAQAGPAGDDAITAAVERAILHDPDLTGMQIDVVTYQNVVQLTGFVDRAETIARAIRVTKGVKGVASVQNDLIAN
jgi:osmotically-inducible protein OsmY